MTAPQEPLDSADLDALLDLERHAGYLLVRERIFDELERERARLESLQDPMTTERIRGVIAALRMALALPGILREEIKGSLDANT